MSGDSGSAATDADARCGKHCSVYRVLTSTLLATIVALSAALLVAVWEGNTLLKNNISFLNNFVDETIDTAIVGGGVGGTYAAWQMKSSDLFSDATIHLFESTHRIGGRFYSPVLAGGCDAAAGTVPEDEQPRGELGGMRLRLGGPDNLLIGACHELDITIVPFTTVDLNLILRHQLASMLGGARPR